MQSLDWFLPSLTQGQWTAHGLIFALNILLLFFAKPILNLIEANRNNQATLRIFQSLNVLVLVLHILDLALLRFSYSYENYLINLGLSLLTLYAGLFLFNLCSFLSRKRFGHEKTLDNKTIFLDTYSSRLVDIILLFIIAATTIYATIKIWGADSMLETTGIFGIIAALLAFTSNIWAPDIISGLIILNTQMLEDGDVVVVDGYPDEYIINKVTLVYVILYDIRNNHRTLIRNSQFTQSKIDNLSRVASTDGIRKSITYKVGYLASKASSEEERQQELQFFKNKVSRVFKNSQEYCSKQKDIMINHSRDFEWALTQTGDYALEFTLWFYLQRIPNTKVTATIRKHLMGTIYKVNEAVYSAAVVEDLDLSTPQLGVVDLKNNNERFAPHHAS